MNTTTKRWVGGLMLASFIAPLAGCQTMNENRAATGAGVGAVAGAVAGALIDRKNPWRGGAIGAVAGAAVGGGIGLVLQKQKQAFDKIQQLETQQRMVPVNYPPPPATPGVPEPTPPPPSQREALVLMIPSEVLFGVDSSTLSPNGSAKLREVAQVLRENPQSQVFVQGYASSDGEDAHNMTLSENRASVVANELIAAGVDRNRVTAQGMGESKPIADNSTEAGRARNRRVEITVLPDEDVR